MKIRHYAAALLLTGIALTVLLTPLIPWALLRAATPFLSPWQLEIEHIDGSLWSGFSLREVHLHNAAEIDLQTTAINLSLRPPTIALQSPHFRVDLSNEKNGEDAPQSVEWPVEWMPNLHVVDGGADIDLGDAGLLHLRNSRVTYRRQTNTTGALEARIASWHIASDSSSLGGDLSGQAILHADRIAISSLQIRAATDSLRAYIQTQGSLALSADRTLQTQSTLRAYAYGDSLSATGTVTGSLWPIALRASLHGSALQDAAGTLDIATVARIDSAEINVDSLAVTAPAGRLWGRARYALANDSLHVELGVNDLNLMQFHPDLSGHADGHLYADVILAARRYSARAELALTAAAWPGTIPFNGTVRAEHKLDGTTHVALDSPPIQMHIDGYSDLSGAYSLNGEGRIVPRAVFDIDMPPFALRAALRPDTLDIVAEATRLPNLGPVPWGPLQAEISLHAWRYANARLSLENETLAAYGLFDLAAHRADSLHLSVQQLSLGRIDSSATGLLSLDLQASGPLALDSLQASASAEISDAGYAQWSAGDFALGGHWLGNSGTGWIRGPQARAEASIDAQRTLETQIAFNGLQLHANERDSLSLTGTLSATGPLADIRTGQAQLDLESLMLSVDPLYLANDSTLSIDYAEGMATLSPVRLHSPIGAIDITGRASNDTLDVSAHWPQIDLTKLDSAFSTRQGSGHLLLTGRPAQPAAAGWFDLQGIQIDTLTLGDMRADWRFDHALHAEFQLQQNSKKVATLNVNVPADSLARAHTALRIDALSLRAPLTYALDRPTRGRLSLTLDMHLPLGANKSLLTPGTLSGALRIAQLSVDTQLQGNPLHVALKPGAHLSANERALNLGALDVQLSRYDRDAETFLPAGTLSLEGYLPTEGPGNAQINAEDVDLFLLGLNEGIATFNAQLIGTTQAPQLTADLIASASDLGNLQGTLKGDGGGARWDFEWTTSLSDRLSVTGNLPWHIDTQHIDWGKGTLTAHSDSVDLAAFAPLLTSFDHLSGQAQGHVQADGLDSTLSLSGHIGVRDVEWALLDVEPAYPLPDGQLVFFGRQGVLRGFDGGPTSSYDTFQLSGALDLSDPSTPNFDLELQSSGLDLRYEDLFRADDINLQLHMAGDAHSARLAGSVVLDAPVAEPVFVELNAPPIPPPPPTLRDEFLENMELDVHVELHDLQVDSELANAKASGGIGIAGTFYKPVFQGDIVLDDGSLYLLNRSFDLQQGRIILNGLVPTRSLLEVAYDPLELDPQLDIRATAHVVDRGDADRDYSVTMSLQGPAQSAAPRFESTPALGFNRIVNLLAFGTTNVSDFNYGTALGTAAGRLLSKRVERVGIDEFAILPSSTIIGVEQGQPALRMGKFVDIPFPMWVRYEAAIRNMSQGEVRIEHRLNSIFTLTGSAQSEYDRYGLGIGLQKEF